MKKQILIFTALLLFTACNKAKHTVLNGQVRTFGSQEAIEHPPVKVQILHQEFGSTGLGGSYTYTPVAETWTDQDGYFTIDADLRKNDSYFLGVDDETVKEGYHYGPTPYDLKDTPERLITDRGGTFTKNYYLSAYGWVRLEIEITNHKSTDRFSYNFGGGAYEEFYGNVNTYRIWDFGGNVEHPMAFTTYVDGEYTMWQDLIFIPALDTITYQIKL